MQKQVVFRQPAGHPKVELVKESLTKTEQGTEVWVKFSRCPSPTLVPATDMANVFANGTACMAIWYVPYMSKNVPLFYIEAVPVWIVGTCKWIIETYEHRHHNVYTKVLRRHGLPGFCGYVAVDGKAKGRQVQSQEACTREGR